MKANAKQLEILQYIEKALKSPKQKQMLNIIGEGGSGKTWIISKIVEKFKDEYPVMVTATTGLAASLISGVTIHSALALKLGINDEANSIDELQKLEREGYGSVPQQSILIIDESSMIGHLLFNEILKAPYRLLILLGDKQQLPPIKEAQVRFNCKTIELTEQMRTKNSSLYKLINDYRQSKEDDGHLDPLEYVDNKSIKLITRSQLYNHYHNNKKKNKKIISYTNEEADNMVDLIKPIDLVFRLNSSINGYDGKANKVMAVNGEEIKITSFPSTWSKAMDSFLRRFGYESKMRIKWSNDQYPIEVVNAAVKNIKMPYCKLFLGRESTIKDITEGYMQLWIIERERLKQIHGKQWKNNKDERYMVAARTLMGISSGVASARHSCSLTAHKAQGQSIESVYINFDNIKRRDLMYVALSRASKEIIFFTTN